MEFEHGFVPGLQFFALAEELSQIFGRKVDLNTPGFLSPYFREQVLAEAEVAYAELMKRRCGFGIGWITP